MLSYGIEPMLYPEVLVALGFDLVREQSYEDDDDEEGSISFALKKMIFPLGLGSTQWSFNPLGLVANLTSNIAPLNIVGSKSTTLDRERHVAKIFSLEFTSKALPFDVNLHPSGKVFVTKSVDSRLKEGVTIFAVNNTPLPISMNSYATLVDLLEAAEIPFTIVFEPLDSQQHHLDPYEEQEDEDEDDEEDAQEDEDESEDGEDDETNQIENKKDSAGADRQRKTNTARSSAKSKGQPTSTDPRLSPEVTAVTATSLLRSGISTTMSTITSRVRALVGVAETDTNPEVSLASSSSSNSTPSVPNKTREDTTHPATKSQPPQPPLAQHASLQDITNNSFNEDGSFNLILNTRSPPFVFDLHADGRSVVVVKLLTDQRDGDSLLQEGCVVRRLNGRTVLCTSRSDFENMLANASLPIRVELETAPSLYRHHDALELYTAGMSEPYLHVFTVLPSVVSNKTRPGSLLFGNAQEYDDVFVTSRRAMQVLQAFRAQGVAVTLVSVETVQVNAGAGAYAGMMAGNSSASARGVRVWFRFSDAIDVGPVDKPLEHLSALQVSRNGLDGSWIVLRCIAESPWVDAGMVLSRPYLLTHVNGRDISASGYRSVQPRVKGNGDWEDSVLPLLEQGGSVRFTLV